MATFHKQNFFRFLLFGIALFLAIGINVSAGAAGSPDAMLFAVMESKPFGFVENGVTKGIHHEIATELARRTGLKFRLEVLPYPRITNGLKDGSVDAVIMWRSSERDSYVNYANFVFTDYTTALTLKSKKNLTAYEELHTIGTVGTLRGNSVSDRFSADTKIKKHEVETYDALYQMLINGRIDAVVGNVYAYLYLANQAGNEDLVNFPGLKLGFREQWLQLSKSSKFLKHEALIKKTIQAMVSDGFVARTNEKYYGAGFRKIKFNN